ncbi:protein of unknown function [Afipia carboxidovorans OM5]|uniref:DUF721 domain-containing protein n=1 Tax=Afipia carboxidovorans (strain ATCC 49405 / DSM 1227 / KCTC 32145 / OM5) TaxID=504832 RepID=B6JF18_AFIC5|nr:DciA family protein [Afipia carboxidovorans]ACI94091.1 protein of unknown function [Afipia carboxidovorans OM5]AEI02250.1 hypothetical protein OCA4_c11070 [Afipia carboxidovorans OM4]AEI05826.1 hypothetical protein OCA5_c11070 [Afipia carboxidovorans OM5]BEV46610.1 DciA family protein [Afipia carboxidovorans]
MSKPGPLTSKPLSALLAGVFNDVFKKQGFASRELVTRWSEIVGSDIATYAEPLKIQWQRPMEGQPDLPATLILRVEGPRALEIQHSSTVILERVNRFFGWNAIGKIALRQAPLSRREKHKAGRRPSETEIADKARELTSVDDEDLRTALARLATSIKRN